MKISRLPLSLCALTLALAGTFALAGCGGGDDEVPADAVAVVDGEEVAKSDYDALLAQAKKSYKNQKREFPKAGSQEFQTLKNQAVQFLVQREQFEQEAEALDVEITEKQVDARLEQIQKQYFGGDKKKFEQQLKDAGPDRSAGAQGHPLADRLGEDLRGGHGQGEGDRQAGRGVLQQEQGAVQPAGEPRGAPHPGQDEGEGGRHLQPAEGGRRLRRPGEEALRGHRFEGERRQADDLEGPDRGAVRPDGVPAEEERDLEAGEDRVRLPRHPADRRRQAGEGDPAEGRQGRRSSSSWRRRRRTRR